MLEYRLFPNGVGSSANARAYTPTSAEGDIMGVHGTLADASLGDWSWKPDRYDARGRYRLSVTGPGCTCTLHQPVGTDCARHN